MLTVTYLFELFNKRIFKFQKITESTSATIETKTDGGYREEIRILREQLNGAFSEEKAIKGVAS